MSTFTDASLGASLDARLVFGSIEKMTKTSMYTTTLLNTLWEFTRGEDKEGFIEKVLKVCKNFKLKYSKRPKLNVPAKKTTYNLFCKDMQETELKGVTVPQASAIISRDGKRLKLATRKMQKYMHLYKLEKLRHEEALQR